MGGFQAGADWQFAPNWVVGAEGQYSWLGKNNLNATFPNGSCLQQRSARDRARSPAASATPGVRAWLYVKGGYAYSDNRDTLTFAGVSGRLRARYATIATATPSAPASEYMFAQNWSAKAEYQYYNFGDTRFVTPGRAGAVRHLPATTNIPLKARRQLSLQLRRAPVVARY